jgi:hypothetical protein
MKARSARLPDRDAITPNTPLHLETAAALAFPDGSISALALRNAAARGELEHMRIGGRILTKLAWIEEFTERCRHKPKGRAYGGAEAPRGQMASAETATGSSKTTTDVSARASAQLVLENLRRQHKTPSLGTSLSSAKPRANVTVLPRPSRSPT